MEDCTTQEDIDRWVERGKKMGATHVISVCDTFSYEDYPVFVMPSDDINQIKNKYNDSGNMSSINEIIKITN